MPTPTKWNPIKRGRLPKRGFIIAGGYRKMPNGFDWSMSSPSEGDGFPRWADDDRTHYCRLPNPPKK